MKKIQKRSLESDFHIREEEGAPVLEGYFIRYNAPAPYGPGMDGVFEQIEPGAVHLRDDVVCLYNHNNDVVLGRQSSNTFEIEDRPDGVYGRCLLNLDDTDARNVYVRVKRGDIKGCSFGFFINEETFDKEQKLVTLKDVDVVELSVCPFPFYEQTSIGTNSLKSEFLKRRFRRWL